MGINKYSKLLRRQLKLPHASLLPMNFLLLTLISTLISCDVWNVTNSKNSKQVFKVDADASTTLQEMKQKIHEVAKSSLSNTEPENQILTYLGTQVDSNLKTLKDLGKSSKKEIFVEFVESSSMQSFVVVDNSIRATHEFSAFPTITISELKEMISNKRDKLAESNISSDGCSPANQTVTYKGKILKDSDTLSSISFDFDSKELKVEYGKADSNNDDEFIWQISDNLGQEFPITIKKSNTLYEIKELIHAVKKSVQDFDPGHQFVCCEGKLLMDDTAIIGNECLDFSKSGIVFFGKVLALEKKENEDGKTVKPVSDSTNWLVYCFVLLLIGGVVGGVYYQMKQSSYLGLDNAFFDEEDSIVNQ